VVPVDMPLTDEMHKVGVKEIIAFRYRLWDEAGKQSYTLLAPDVFIPDGLINNILDKFLTIKTINDIQRLVEQHTHVAKHSTELFGIIETLHVKFLSMLEVTELTDQVTNLSNVEEAPDGEVPVFEGKIRWRINTSYVIPLCLGHFRLTIYSQSIPSITVDFVPFEANTNAAMQEQYVWLALDIHTDSECLFITQK
jgi:hypothetical protein